MRKHTLPSSFKVLGPDFFMCPNEKNVFKKKRNDSHTSLLLYPASCTAEGWTGWMNFLRGDGIASGERRLPGGTDFRMGDISRKIRYKL